MSTYVWRDGKFRDKKTGEPMLKADANWVPKAPRYIIQDMPAHEGPSGRYISGRAEAREECKRTDTVFRDIKRRPKGYLNPKSAEGSRLGWNREFVEHFNEQKIKAFKAAGL
jgi:hypothetical protein